MRFQLLESGDPPVHSIVGIIGFLIAKPGKDTRDLWMVGYTLK